MHAEHGLEEGICELHYHALDGQKPHEEDLEECLAASVATELFQAVMVLDKEHCYFLYQRVLCPCFLLGVPWCLVYLCL